MQNTYSWLLGWRCRALSALLAALLVGVPGGAEVLGVPDIEIAPPVAAVRAESNNRPQMAFNQGRWLVVWGNKEITGSLHSRVRAALMDDSGTLLTPFSINLGWQQQFPIRVEEVCVAALGDGFVIAWTQINTHDETYTAQVVAAVIDWEGRVVRGPLAMGDANGIARFPQLATSGASALLVWLDDIQRDGTLELKGLVFDGTLSPTSSILTLSPGGTAQRPGSVACGGGKFLVIWEQVMGVGKPVTVQGTLVGLDGVPSEPFAITSGTQDGYPRVARLGEGTLVVWHDFSRDFGPGVGAFGDVKAVRVSTSGHVLDSPPLLLRDNPRNESVLFANVSGNESGALVTWTEPVPNSTKWQTVVRRIATDGAVSQPPGNPPVVESFQIYDTVSMPGTDSWLIAHSRDEPIPLNGQWLSDVFVRKLESNGAAGGPEIRVSATANRMEAVAVRPHGGGYIAVWQDDRQARTGEWDIYARRFRPDGTPIDAAPLVVADAAEDEISPAVASAGDVWTVVWRTDGAENSRIAARVMVGGAASSDTLLLDESERSSVPKAPEITAGPGGFFAVWVGTDKRISEVTRNAILGTGLSTTGQIETPGGFYLSSEALSDQEAPAVTSNGASYLVAWRKDFDGSNPMSILGRWLPSTLPPAAGAPPPFEISSINGPRGPDIASHGENYLVVWRTSANKDRIWGARVDGAGHMLQPTKQLFDPDLSGRSLKEPTAATTSAGWLIACFARTQIQGVEVADTEAFTLGMPFALTPLTQAPLLDAETLTAASLSDRVVFGYVKGPMQSAAAGIAFPGRRVPQLTADWDALGNLRVAGPTDPYFPMLPSQIEVSADGQNWTSIYDLPLGSWSQQMDGSMTFAPRRQLLLVRLKGTLAVP